MSSTGCVPEQGQRLREELHATLGRHTEELADGLITWLRDPTSRQFWEAEANGQLREAAVRLVDEFLGSLLEGPQQFVRHVQHEAGLWGDAANGLRNLWLALTQLEDKIWRIVAQEVPVAHQVRLLSWVTQTIGAAKDRLACALMNRLEQSRFRAGVLEESLSLLSRGTDPGPEDLERRERPQIVG